MGVDRLSSKELAYELKVRGIDPQGGVEILRKLLGQVLKTENSDPTFRYRSNPFTLEEDISAVRETISLSRELIADFDDSIHGGSYKKINSKIAHAESRLLRTRVDSNTETTVTELKEELKSLEKSILVKVQNFEESFTELPIGKEECPCQKLKLFQFTVVSSIFRRSDRCVIDKRFLERVEELTVTRNVSYEMLCDSAINLFKGKLVFGSEHIDL
ncbi:hypothetical protein FQA39_LY09305 [Lamprigera yunnana]|nr:hypothetical protein FQA39_LY09305 [Lamprigera yunnana]